MNKTLYLSDLQRRMPKGYFIEDQTPFDFTEDEFIVMLSWIRYLKSHGEIGDNQVSANVYFPMVSKRMRLEPDVDATKDQYGNIAVYIVPNGQRTDGSIDENVSVDELIKTWDL